MTVREDKKLTAMYPQAAPNRLTIQLKNGKTLQKEVLYHRGHNKNKMSDKEIENKFNNLTEQYSSGAKRNKILKDIWNLENGKFGWKVLGKF